MHYRALCLMLLLLPLNSLLADDQQPVADRHHASILMYHHVSSSTPASTSVSPQRFIEHLELLQHEGFLVWPLEQIVAHLQNEQPMPDKVVALTFDDAFVSVYETALPELQERGWPFTIFVNATSIERGHPLNMTWDQLRAAREAGATIANHYLTHDHMHRRLEGETDEQWAARIRRDLAENQRLLEENIGVSLPRFLAYPYGEYSPELQAIVADMGYVGFGQQSGAASRFTSMTAIPRWAANGIYSDPTSLRTKLYALPFPLISEEPESTLLDGQNRHPALTLTLAPGDYNLRTLTCYGPNSRVLPVTQRQLPDGNIEIQVTTQQSLATGRPRYNCTARHKTENRYYWFTRQWLMPRPDGSWYDG